MSWSGVGSLGRVRKKVGFSVATIEALERRALLADGIAPAAGPPLTAQVGVPITNAVFASYSVTDPSGQPGDQWRAHIKFGDGQDDGPVIPVQKGDRFLFLDSHTYQAPGTYTVSVMIAEPGSHAPDDNTVTTQVTVTASSPTPTPPPPDASFVASGLKLRQRSDRAFTKSIALFREPNAHPRDFQATIAWGDRTGITAGRVHIVGSGRFQVIGSHRYINPGLYLVNVNIRDAAGRLVGSTSSVRVVKQPSASFRPRDSESGPVGAETMSLPELFA